MTYSMTGFARLEQEFPWGRLSCEIRSVNHRYLEPTLRIPDSLRIAEGALREMLKKSLSRGKVELSIYIKQENNDGSAINEQALNGLVQLLNTVNAKIPNPAPLNSLEVLRWPGVVQAQELDSDELVIASKHLLANTLEEIKKFRAREGEGLKQHIQTRLAAIKSHVAQLRTEMPILVDAQQEKLKQKVESLQVDIDQDRLAQELVIIAQKADVAEELDRLETHIQETERTLEKNEPIGRRLDFLMQEFNREANTLSSKAIASGVTQIAVELKVLIEQMREQIQNIE